MARADLRELLETTEAVNRTGGLLLFQTSMTAIHKDCCGAEQVDIAMRCGFPEGHFRVQRKPLALFPTSAENGIVD
jgi:hypothetical protein